MEEICEVVVVFGADRNILTFLLELLNLLLRSTNTGKQLFLQGSDFLRESECFNPVQLMYAKCTMNVQGVYEECTRSV